MKLEAGKTYKTRGGAIYGPLLCERDKTRGWPFHVIGNDGKHVPCWTEEGFIGFSDITQNQHDLVSEVITAAERRREVTRKEYPLYRGLFCYFPDALAEVARVSAVGNEQHNSGEHLHWAREKSTDHEDCLLRHLMDEARGQSVDTDGMLHAAKVAWRALARLQLILESQRESVPEPTSAQPST